MNIACGASEHGGHYGFTVPFSACNVQPVTEQSPADENGIRWYTYTIFLNFDYPLGLISLGQTRVDCKIPANIQESAENGVFVQDGDQIGDQVQDDEMWNQLQLDCYKGGTGANAVYPEEPLADGETIMLGENVKLAISGEATLNYK